MTLTSCAECGAQISTKARACPQCGARRATTKWWLWAPLGVLVVAAVAAAVRSPAPVTSSKEADRQEVIACWNGIDPKSQSQESASMAAAYCEGLEASFTAKYLHPPLPPGR